MSLACAAERKDTAGDNGVSGRVTKSENLARFWRALSSIPAIIAPAARHAAYRGRSEGDV